MAIVNNTNVLKLSEFLPSVKNQLNEKLQDVIGGVLTSSNSAWLASGSKLIVVSNFDASTRTEWSFGQEDDNSDITCVTELPIEKCEIPLLIVGISSENYSKICILNPNTRKVIRTLQVDIQVRCLCLVEDGDITNVHPLPEILGQMKGVLAVGGADGSLILTDLNREYIIRALEGELRYESNEYNPRELKLVSVEDNAAVMQLKLNNAQLNGDSLGIVLIDGTICEDDGLTALEYSKETACLYVGFNSGSWEIWNLITFRQLYGSPESEFPVFGFGQLEPCDDPRHTVYVWVACQAPSHSLPLASLYMISYNSKDFVPGYGTFYEGYQQCNLVFEMSPGEEVEGILSAKVVSVETISKTINKNSNSCIGLPDSEGTQIRVAATAYIVETKSSTETRMVLFDLNRWYAEQMPPSIEETSVVLTRAGVVRALLDLSTLSGSQLITVKLLQNTVDAYTNPLADTAYGQISIELIGVNIDGILHAEKLGAQRQWLRNSEIVGSRSLIHPQQLYRACLNSGLSVIYIDYFDLDNPSIEEMRSYILSVWLEYRMYSCIMECADSWCNGSHSVSGCTLPYLLDWLWGQLVHCKTLAHHLCRTLFDTSGMEFDLTERKKLYNCKMTIHAIHSLYSQIVQKHSKFILSDNTENKLKAMSLLIQYIDQVVFFTYIGVLPEQNHLGMPRSSLTYDFIRLQKYVSQRNLYLMRALDECKRTKPHIVPPVEGLYMVNSFNCLDDGVKVIDYPPHNMQLLLRIWLKVELPMEKKFSLCYYFLLDLMHICEDDKYHTCMEKITNYPFSLGMRNSQVSLVKALWNLDHSFYEDGMKLLMSPQLLPSDVTDSQSRSILRLLFVESRYNLALQYLKTKQPALHLPDDLKLEMSLLLSNHLIDEAHIFQRRNSHLRESLLMQFFSEQDFNQLMRVINLNLDNKEEAWFRKFLNEQNNPKYDDLQIMFLVSRAKYTEAVEVHRKLKAHNGPNGTTTRDRFVKGISSSLSSVNKLISNEEFLVKTYPVPNGGPKPLSVYIKTSVEQGFPAPQKSSNAVAALALMCARKSWNNYQNKGESKVPKIDSLPSKASGIREVVGIRPRPAPPTPFPHGKRIRSTEEELTSDLLVVHHKKKQKLEENKEVIDKQEIEMLLATPIIERRRPPRSEDVITPVPSGLPHSILKKIGDTKVKTPSKNEKVNGTEEPEYLTPRKLLRFTLPREERESGELKSSVRVSARRSLRALRNSSSAAVGTDHVESLDISGSSGSTSSSVSLDISSMKELPASTPLRSPLKHVTPVDWKSIMEAARPKTLFSVGADETKNQRKVKSYSRDTFSHPVKSNLTHVDSFLKKMGIQPGLSASRKEKREDDEERFTTRVDEMKKVSNGIEQSKAATEENVLYKYSNETSSLCVQAENLEAGIEEEDKNADGEPSKSDAQEHKLYTPYSRRTRSNAAMRSSSLVEDLLTTPRTRLRRRIGEMVSDHITKNKIDTQDKKSDEDNEEVDAEVIEATPKRRTKKIEMHIEKKVRMEIEEEVEDDEDEEENVENKVGQEKEIKISLEECMEGEAAHIVSNVAPSEIETNVIETPAKSTEECEVEAEVNTYNREGEERVAENDEKDIEETVFPQKKMMKLSALNEDECKIVEDEEKETEESVFKESDDKIDDEEKPLKDNYSFDDIVSDDVEEDVGSHMKISNVCSLSAAVPARDYHALTPMSDPIMLGAVAPAQPVQDYFSHDNDEEDDLYGGLEEAEEAEIPPKMDFDQPEEGFGGLYDDLYEPDNLNTSAVNSVQKRQKSDSESSVICLDSDSEPESRSPAKIKSSKPNYEEENCSTDAEETRSSSTSSPPVRTRSFFHDKFGNIPESEEVVEEEETDGESVRSAGEANDDEEEGEDVYGEDEEEVDEEEDEEEEEDDDRENHDTEDEIEEVGVSQSEGSSEPSEVEPDPNESNSQDEKTNTNETEIINQTIQEEEKNQEVMPEIELDITKESQEIPTEEVECKDVDDEGHKLEIHVPDREESVPIQIVSQNELDVQRKQVRSEDSKVIMGDKQLEESTSYSIRIEEVSSVDKQEELEELWLSPVVEEVEDTEDDAKDVAVGGATAGSITKKGNEIDEQTLAALSLRRVEDVEMTPADKKRKIENECTHSLAVASNSFPEINEKSTKEEFKDDVNVELEVKKNESEGALKIKSNEKRTSMEQNVDISEQAKLEKSERFLENKVGENVDPLEHGKSNVENEQPKVVNKNEVFGVECAEKIAERNTGNRDELRAELTESTEQIKEQDDRKTEELLGIKSTSQEVIDDIVHDSTPGRSVEDEQLGKKDGIDELENVVDKVDLSATESEKQESVVLTSCLGNVPNILYSQEETSGTEKHGIIDSSVVTFTKEIKQTDNVNEKKDHILVETNNSQSKLKIEEIGKEVVHCKVVEEKDVTKDEKVKEFASRDKGASTENLMDFEGIKKKNEASVPATTKVSEGNIENSETGETAQKSQLMDSKNEKSENDVRKRSNKIPADLFVLSKGQMFFGSPEDVKTSASELATFQVGRSSLTSLPEDEKCTTNKELKKDNNDLSHSNTEADKLPEGAKDLSGVSSSSEYTVAEMDIAMIVSDPASTPSCSYVISTPIQTPSNVQTRKRKYKSTPGKYLQQKHFEGSDEEDNDTSYGICDKAVIAEDKEELLQDTRKTDLENLKQVASHKEVRSETEVVQSPKKVVDRSMITDKIGIIDSSLDYLELCIPGGLPLKSSRVNVPADRNRRASSEQPSSQKVISDKVTVSGARTSLARRHTRKSLDVARIYPAKKRELGKRERTSSENSNEDETTSKFSLEEFIHTRRSVSSKASTSETVQEELDDKQEQRERRSSCSHRGRTERLREVHKKDSESLKSHSNVQDIQPKDLKKSKKSPSKEQESVSPQQETSMKKVRRKSKKSSILSSPPLTVVAEEETPKSIDTKARVRKHGISEPLAKRWKPSRLDFDNHEYELRSAKHETSPGKKRSEKSRSLPSLSPKKSSVRLSGLPSLNEEEEEEEESDSSRLKTESGTRFHKSPSDSSSQMKRRKSIHSELNTMESIEKTFAPPQQVVEELTFEKRKSGRPRSLPDLSRKKKSSIRPPILPKLSEEEEEAGESQEEKISRSGRRSSVSTASSSSRGHNTSTKHATSKTSITEGPSAKELYTVAENAASWAEKMFGKTQAKWWSKIEEQQRLKKALQQNTDSESQSSTSVLSSAGANTRSKTSGTSLTLDLSTKLPSPKKRKDVESESVKSDKSVRSLRSRKDVETSSVKSDKSGRSLGRRREKEITSPVSSEKSVKVNRRRNELDILLSSPDTTQKIRRPRRDVETSSTSSEKSNKKRMRSKRESSPSTTSIQTVGSDEGETMMESLEPEPDKDVTILVEEYAENRRLTRHQKNLLERSLTIETQVSSKKKKNQEEKSSESDEEEAVFTPAKSKNRRNK